MTNRVIKEPDLAGGITNAMRVRARENSVRERMSRMTQLYWHQRTCPHCNGTAEPHDQVISRLFKYITPQEGGPTHGGH